MIRASKAGTMDDFRGWLNQLILEWCKPIADRVWFNVSPLERENQGWTECMRTRHATGSAPCLWHREGTSDLSATNRTQDSRRHDQPINPVIYLAYNDAGGQNVYGSRWLNSSHPDHYFLLISSLAKSSLDGGGSNYTLNTDIGVARRGLAGSYQSPHWRFEAIHQSGIRNF